MKLVEAIVNQLHQILRHSTQSAVEVHSRRDSLKTQDFTLL